MDFLPTVEEPAGLIYRAMKYSLEAGGKRLRPVLLLAACQAVSGDCSRALPFACAIEFIHTYSLIHDDHPSMDNDDLRRGIPTNHKVFGDDIAILAGDGLLNSAMDVMLETVISCSREEERTRMLKAAWEISSAAGVRGMVSGQTADVIMTGGGRERVSPPASDEEAGDVLRFIHRNKTGALIRAAVRSGAVIGGAGESVLESLTEYSEKIGLVFQIVDDVLDVIGDEKLLGKKTGADQALGKLTYPGLYGLQESERLAEAYTSQALEALKKMGQEADFLRQLALDLQKRIS